ncbi:MAG: SiaB family protein kinase [Bacteroidales bacterium]|nr:SiaB family protein kinase [Bacteroidales bacterium]
MFAKSTYSNNILAFNGPLNLDMVSTLANYTKRLINSDLSIKQKVFRIFIELVQNVSFYSAKTYELESHRRVGAGWCEVNDTSEYYLIKTGNLILHQHVEILEKNCIEINSKNFEELRELKRQTRKKAPIKDIGAHIGLIQTVILSGNAVKIETEKIDNEYSFFTIEARVDKQLKDSI